MNQEIKIDSPCAHPGGESGAWEHMTIVGGTQSEHDDSVVLAIMAGWEIWIDGNIEINEGNVSVVCLFRKLTT